MADLEDRFLGFLRKRIAEMGVEGSGAGEDYQLRAQRGEAFTDAERVVMRDVLALRPSRVLHVGTGMGAVAAALAQSGVPVTGYEVDDARFAAAEALRETLALRYGLENAPYPDDDDGQGGLLLVSGLRADWNRRQEAAVIETFGAFDVVIVDLRLFGSVRDAPAERDDLRRRIAEIGKVEELPATAGAQYIRLRPSKDARARALSKVNLPMKKKPIAKLSTPVSPLESLEAELVAIHKKRLDAMGADDSGLFDHYAQLVNEGAVFSYGDRDRIKYILEDLPAYDQYIVYRAGLGEVAFGLAAAGRKVVAWEPNPKRRQAIADGLAILSKQNKTIRENFSVADGSLDSIDVATGKTSLGVGAVLVGIDTEEARPATLKALGRTSALLYSPRLFLVMRDAATADKEVRALLKSAGFKTFDQALGDLVVAAKEANAGSSKPRLTFVPA